MPQSPKAESSKGNGKPFLFLLLSMALVWIYGYTPSFQLRAYIKPQHPDSGQFCLSCDPLRNWLKNERYRNTGNVRKPLVFFEHFDDDPSLSLPAAKTVRRSTAKLSSISTLFLFCPQRLLYSGRFLSIWSIYSTLYADGGTVPIVKITFFPYCFVPFSALFFPTVC